MADGAPTERQADDESAERAPDRVGSGARRPRVPGPGLPLRDRIRALWRRHTPTVLFVELLVVVYALEWVVATAVGAGAYRRLFVASVGPSPGWVLAPFAHAIGDPVHLFSSAVVILVFGPLVERALPGWRYVGFCLVAAYLSLGAQVATYLSGDPRGTLGASGVAMAMVALVAVDAGRRYLDPGARVERWEGGFAGVGLVFLSRQLERDLGLLAPAVGESALVGHLAGSVFGALCALWLAART